MESGACLVAAHSLPRVGGLLQVPLCEKLCRTTARHGRVSRATARHGRLSSATARHGRLSSATARHIRLSSGSPRHRRPSSAAWWTDIDGLIGSAVFVVMQPHG